MHFFVEFTLTQSEITPAKVGRPYRSFSLNLVSINVYGLYHFNTEQMASYI